VRLLTAIAVVLLSSFVVNAQESKDQSSRESASLAVPATVIAQGVDPQFGRRRNQRDPDEIQQQRAQLKALNKDRQKKLQEDTDKLLKLATELKEYVDKTNENILSVDVIKKTDEIEKLAKSVREKMKTYYEMPTEGIGPRGRGGS
jgi:Spy/CpxP family protein refolding chaperone